MVGQRILALVALALLLSAGFANAEYTLNTTDLRMTFDQSVVFAKVGQTLTLGTRTYNDGNITTPRSSTIVESFPDGARVWLHMPEIKAYEYRETLFNFTCPSPGAFHLNGKADFYDIVNETNESNNIDAMQINCEKAGVSRNLPDLISFFDQETLSGLVGSTVLAVFHTRNLGDGASGNTTTQLLMQNGTRLYYSVPGLATGEELAERMAFPCTAPGLFIITASADSRTQERETQESNNHDLLTVKCGWQNDSLSDLQSSFAKDSIKAAVGSKAVLQENTSNAGKTPAMASTTKFKYPDGKVVLLRTRALAANSFELHSIEFDCREEGVFEVSSISDANGEVVEANELNNQNFVQVYCVNGSSLPQARLSDLSVEFIDSNLTAYLGDALLLHVRVSNNGSDAADASRVRTWWAFGVNYYPVDSIGVGESKTVVHPFNCSRTGDFGLKAAADVDDAVDESNELNNRAEAHVRCLSQFEQFPKIAIGSPTPFLQINNEDDLGIVRAANDVLAALGRIISSFLQLR